MKTIKVWGAAMVVAFCATIIGSLAFAHADSGNLAVTCSGVASGTDQIVWSAVATGGNSPYRFVWSGDSSIANSTGTTATGTYIANATYTAYVTVTDASSTMASSSCSQAVTGIVMPATTSTLDVIVSVNNAAGGSATSSSFAANVAGASATPDSFAGSLAGTNVVVLSNANYSVGASALADYSASESGNCAGPIAAGGAASCTVTETYAPPVVATSTPRVNPPSLSIGPGGSFLARGMTVTSVGTNSFTATVWGITYTVNWSGTLSSPFEFYFRYGSQATSTPAEQLQVGDEVGVAGSVASGSPMVVSANVVRDYSIVTSRPVPVFHNNGNDHGDNGNNGGGVSAGAGADFSARLSGLLQQFKNLQNLFNGRGRGN